MGRLNKLKFKVGNKEFSLSFIFSVLSSAIGAVFSFLCAKFLQSELYGELQYYISIVSLLNVFMLFGVDYYIIKNGQYHTNKQELQSNAFLFVTFLSLFIFPIYFRIASSFLVRFNGNDGLILLLFIMSLALAFSTIFFSYLQSINKYQLKMFFASLLPHLAFLIIFLIHLLTNSLDAFMDLYLVYYFAIYGLIGIIMFIKYIFPIGRFFTIKDCISIIIFGLSYSLYNCTNAISSIFIGEKYEDFGVVGIFSLSNQLLSIAGLATGIISQTSMTTFSKLTKEDNKKQLFLNFERITRIQMYISVPFYAAFIFEAKRVMGFFGDSYLGNNFILILLSISALIDCVTGPCGSILLMGGKEKENLIASIIKIVIFLATLAALIKYTPLAAPIASIVSAVIANGIKLFYVSKFQKKIYLTFNIILTFICVFLISSLVFFGLSFISNKILWAVLNCTCGIGLIIAFILFTPFKGDRQYFSRGKEL